MQSRGTLLSKGRAQVTTRTSTKNYTAKADNLTSKTFLKKNRDKSYSQKTVFDASCKGRMTLSTREINDYNGCSHRASVRDVLSLRSMMSALFLPI